MATVWRQSNTHTHTNTQKHIYSKPYSVEITLIEIGIWCRGHVTFMVGLVKFDNRVPDWRRLCFHVTTARNQFRVKWLVIDERWSFAWTHVMMIIDVRMTTYWCLFISATHTQIISCLIEFHLAFSTPRWAVRSNWEKINYFNQRDYTEAHKKTFFECNQRKIF